MTFIDVAKEHNFKSQLSIEGQSRILAKFGSVENWNESLHQAKNKQKLNSDSDSKKSKRRYMLKVTIQDYLEGINATIGCDNGTYILDAAEEAGFDLNYSCRAGMCSSCVGRIWRGNVDQADQSFLTDDELADRWVLICVAYPMSDCTIGVNQEEKLY